MADEETAPAQGELAITRTGDKLRLAREMAVRFHDAAQAEQAYSNVHAAVTAAGGSFADIAKLLSVLKRLTESGNTVIVIEHNLDVVKSADWIIDLGPEGGSGGGQIVATGTPEQVAKVEGSHTGAFLAEVLDAPATTVRKAG